MKAPEQKLSGIMCLGRFDGKRIKESKIRPGDVVSWRSIKLENMIVSEHSWIKDTWMVIAVTPEGLFLFNFFGNHLRKIDSNPTDDVRLMARP